MEKYKWSLVLSVSAICGVIAWSPPSGDDLIVGPVGDGTSDNTVQSSTGYLGVIGSGNKAKLRDGLIVGTNNKVNPENADPYADQTLVVGTGNVLSGGKARNLVSGNSNSVESQNSFVAGTENWVKPAGATSYECAAIGRSNKVFSERGWAMGFGNTVTGNYGVAIGDSNQPAAQHTFALGQGLKIDQVGVTAVGAWNAPVAFGDVFAVGAGSSDTVRSTALKVTRDGSVLLGRAQGDITMGDYQ